MRATVPAALAMLLAMLLAVGAAPLDGTDQLMFAFNESMGFDNPYLEAMRWPGPQRGCEPEPGAGSELRVNCGLAAARFTIATNRAATYLTLECDTAGSVTATVTCDELRNNTGEALRNHISEALEQHAGGPRALRSLTVSGCVVPGALRCLLALVAATDVALVTLQHVALPLRPELLQGLSSLKHLRLIDIDANVTSLPYEALAALPALRRLDVHGGALQLPAGGARWQPLQQLQMLELADGKLRALPARAFLGLSELRNLSLWANQIETLDENAFEGLSRLECLSLNSNRLRLLPRGALRPAPRLRTLHLYDNRLAALPDLRNLTSLEQVWVNNMNQSTLALDNDTFAGLPALRRLQLESCGVAALPAALLAGCPALTELSLAGNRLAALPTGLLARHAALRKLNLARNRLRDLPRALFADAAALEMLELQYNQLEVLPNGVFLHLAALKNLNLSHNKLTQLSPNVFDGLSSIGSLDLSHNALSLAAAADAGARLASPLAELRSLSRVSLAHNRLQYFMDDWRDLHHLEFLDLSYNYIQELSDIDLQLLSEAEVDVRHNKISRVRQLPAAALAAAAGELSRARFLLDDNPFHCDCYMYDFLVALGRPTIAGQFDLGHARCVSPPRLAGELLSDVAPAALVCPLPRCPENCTCSLRPANHSVELDCERVPRWWPELEEGDVVRLRVRAPPADVAALPAAVRVLDLSGLRLRAAPAAARPTPRLTVDLSNNSLTTAPLSLLEANVTVLLGGNPLACDCSHRASVAALRRHWARVADGATLRCAGGGWARAQDAAALCAARDALALGLGAGLAAALLVLLLFRYRTEVRLVLGRFKLFDFLLPNKDLGSQDKTYDAFVSFSHHDEAYVRDVLVPALEGGRRPLRLCLHYRDWEVGDLIPDQIDRSVRDSWRTIVVLSEDFARSVWGRHEFRAAHSLERVIVLVLGDALRAMDADKELRAYKKTHTCIMASHPLVWDRIRDAVYRSKCAAPPPAAAAGDEGTKPAGGLDVQLQNGQLVNQAVTAVKPEKISPLFANFPYINSKVNLRKG